MKFGVLSFFSVVEEYGCNQLTEMFLILILIDLSSQGGRVSPQQAYRHSSEPSVAFCCWVVSGDLIIAVPIFYQVIYPQ